MLDAFGPITGGSMRDGAPHKRSPSRRPPSRKTARRRVAFDPKKLPVLIVDDEPSNAKLLDVVLRDEGCDTRVVGSAEEALQELLTFRPRVLVLDLILPLMSGLLLAERLKSEPATRDIVIVAVTAFNDPTVERLALEAGCSAYIRKPIDPLSFAQTLLDHVRGAR